MESYCHLSRDERDEIFVLHSAGHSQVQIAGCLKRSAWTISRELGRHRLMSGEYRSNYAHGGYLMARQRQSILETCIRLKDFVIQRLTEAWSPEQISGWLRGGHERGLPYVGTETIYSWIYSDDLKAEALWKYLPRNHRKRRKQGVRAVKTRIKDRKSIHDRPDSVDQRAEFGDFECDYMMCNRTCPILVLHERKSRFTFAARLTGRTAAETAETLMSIFRKLDPKLRKSVTFDNDTGFAFHKLLTDKLNIATWFCDTYASWQKGAVENTNGRLRRWLPRNCDPESLTDEEIQEVVMTMNITPRKCLGFKTPLQALFDTPDRMLKISFA